MKQKEKLKNVMVAKVLQVEHSPKTGVSVSTFKEGAQEISDEAPVDESYVSQSTG